MSTKTDFVLYTKQYKDAHGLRFTKHWVSIDSINSYEIENEMAFYPFNPMMYKHISFSLACVSLWSACGSGTVYEAVGSEEEIGYVSIYELESYVCGKVAMNHGPRVIKPLSGDELAPLTKIFNSKFLRDQKNSIVRNRSFGPKIIEKKQSLAGKIAKPLIYIDAIAIDFPMTLAINSAYLVYGICLAPVRGIGSFFQEDEQNPQNVESEPSAQK